MTLNKARLAGAARRTGTHQLRVEDDAAARTELAAALSSEDEQRITAAREALTACYEPLKLTAMPAEDWDDLVTAHPPPDKLKDRVWCDVGTFLPAALAVCAETDDITEADWADHVNKGAMAPGEVRALLDDLVALHDRSPNVGLPKDLTGNRS